MFLLLHGDLLNEILQQLLHVTLMIVDLALVVVDTAIMLVLNCYDMLLIMALRLLVIVQH